MDLKSYLETSGVSQSELCRIIGAHAPDVSRWLDKTRKVPQDRCPLIEKATGGKVTCDELRKDLTWSRIEDKSWPNKKGRPVLDFAKAAA